jgi:cytochrome c peroxidase
LRDLEDSAPYFHNGSKAKFDDVVNFYINASQLMRQGKLYFAPEQARFIRAELLTRLASR